VNRADGEEDRFEGVNAPAFDRLQSGDAFGGNEHGVHAFIGPGGVGAFAVEGNREDIGRSLSGACEVTDLADFSFRRGVKAEDGERPRIFERTFFYHKFCAAFLAWRRTFLSGLKEEFDRAMDLIPDFG